MTGKILKYFAGGNTALGFYSLFDSALAGLNRLYILKGGPGTGKSSLMKKIANKWVTNGYDIEMIYCSSDSISIDGIIIPAIKAGIVDGTAPHVIEPKAPGAVEEYINLGIAWDAEKLSPKKDEILSLQEEIGKYYEQAYASFASGLKIHDRLEKIYINQMDFTKANELTKRIENAIFKDKKTTKKSAVVHRFLGAATPTGPVNFIENITTGLSTRYFIKGRAGTGKSTLQKKLITAAEERGFNIEIYHCGFDPKSIDMVVFRELGTAIFDSTAPHELFPSRQGDEVIDMYKETIPSGTDEKYADEIQQVFKMYKEKMQQGTSLLAKAKEVRDQLEAIYVDAMDFTKIDKITEEIQAALVSIAQSKNV